MESLRENFVLEKRKVILEAYNKIIDVKLCQLRCETNKKEKEEIEIEIYELIHTTEEV